MKKRILVILGHPKTDSFCGALCNAFIKGAEANGSEVRQIKVGELAFDPVLWKGYDEIQELEPDLVKCQEDILWAEHMVFVYPIWWGSIPSLLKGFFDRIFLPGFSFKYRDDSPFWDKLLTGRSSQLLVTMDTPSWYYRWIEFSPMKGSSQEKRARWLEVAEELGRKA